MLEYKSNDGIFLKAKTTVENLVICPAVEGF